MKTLNQFETYLVHEFVEDYEDGIMSRRDMVRRVMHITGGVAAAATTLTKLGVSPVSAQEGTPQPQPTPTGPRSPLSVAADDPGISAMDVTYPALDGSEIMAYLAMPASMATPGASADRWPAVMVCHENRGLTEHIRDVTRRWAASGYVAIAPDLLSREGGTANVPDPAEIPALLTGDSTPPERHVDDFKAAAAWLAEQPMVDPAKLGMNGYCFGGGITWRCAEQIPELKAAAPFYGPPPPLEDVPNIKAAVFGVYAEDPNDFANEGREELAAALEAAGITFEIMVYPGTQHAFHNDTGARWNEEQALAAWNDMQAWFTTYVKEAGS